MRHRPFDWRLWLSVAFLLLVGYLTWSGLESVQDGHAKDRRIDALIAQGAEDRRTAEANQRALLDYTKRLADRQDALLEWLRRNGIDLPARYVTEIPAPRIVVTRGGGTGSPHHQGTHGHTGGHHGRPPSPGKSGHAHGHRHHRK